MNHPKPNDGSPDDNANREIAAQLRTFAGTCKGDSKLYPVGRINTIIYPVDGGMEDWM